MKARIFGAVMAAALAVSGGAVQAQEQFPAGSTMEKLAKAGKVRIGVKFDQPLFGLRNLRGQPEGFDVEIGKIIAKKLGIDEKNIEWVETVSANREAFLQQNKADMVIATYAITPKRREVVTFAGPYIITGQDLMVKKGNPENIKGPDDLKGKKVCVLNGSENRLNIVNNYPDITPVGFDAFSKCAEAVKNDSLPAATLSGAVILGYVAKEPDQFEMVGNRFSNEPWGIGVKKGDIAFCEFVRDALKAADADGRYKTAYDKTVGEHLKDEPKLPELDPCT